jgi:hypothetical protein
LKFTWSDALIIKTLYSEFDLNLSEDSKDTSESLIRPSGKAAAAIKVNLIKWKLFHENGFIYGLYRTYRVTQYIYIYMQNPGKIACKWDCKMNSNELNLFKIGEFKIIHI